MKRRQNTTNENIALLISIRQAKSIGFIARGSIVYVTISTIIYTATQKYRRASPLRKTRTYT